MYKKDVANLVFGRVLKYKIMKVKFKTKLICRYSFKKVTPCKCKQKPYPDVMLDILSL